MSKNNVKKNNQEQKEDSKEQLLEQYKLFVEMTDRISNRRNEMNKFYVSLLSSLMAVLALITGKDDFYVEKIFIFILVVTLTFAFLYLWGKSISSYKQLNSGKFKVISEMEKLLPYPCYDKEWEFLGKGKDPKKYAPVTELELKTVKIIICVYIFLLLSFFIYKAIKIWMI